MGSSDKGRHITPGAGCSESCTSGSEGEGTLVTGYPTLTKKASYAELVKPINQLINIGPQQIKLLAAVLGRWWVKMPLSNVTAKQTLGTNKTTRNFRNGTCGKLNQLLAESGW
jgi:hypothetical protein